MSNEKSWDEQYYHGWTNRYPFIEVVSFIMRNFGKSDRKNIKVLDLGCGGGHHLLFLANEKFDYYGIDGAKRGVEIAKERLREKNFSDEKVYLGTFDNLPFVENYFDCIIDRGALVCNKKENLGPILNQVYKVLKPGGKFFSAFLHEESTSKNFAQHLGNNDYSNFTGRLKDSGILHFIANDEINEIFSAFQIDDVMIQKNYSIWGDQTNSEVNSWAFIFCSK